MKRVLVAAAAALVCLALSNSSAHAWGCRTCLGPWYQYWPYEAHFVTPAPTGFPYWPSPMTLPPGFDLSGGYHGHSHWFGH